MGERGERRTNREKMDEKKTKRRGAVARGYRTANNGREAPPAVKIARATLPPTCRFARFIAGGLKKKRRTRGWEQAGIWGDGRGYIRSAILLRVVEEGLNEGKKGAESRGYPAREERREREKERGENNPQFIIFIAGDR